MHMTKAHGTQKYQKQKYSKHFRINNHINVVWNNSFRRIFKKIIVVGVRVSRSYCIF